MKKPTLNKSVLFVAFCTMLILGCKETPKEAEVEETVAATELTDEAFNALWQNVDALWEQRNPALIHTV